MSRFYESEGENPADLLYWPNLNRACRGPKGQKMLREVIAALEALPERRLIASEIATPKGDVCAVGAYAKYKGAEFPDGLEGDQDETIELGMKYGLHKMIAWHLGFMNDVDFGGQRTAYMPHKTVTVEVIDDSRSSVRMALMSALNRQWDGNPETHPLRRLERVRVPDYDSGVEFYGCDDGERWKRIHRWCVEQVRWNLPAVIA